MQNKLIVLSLIINTIFLPGNVCSAQGDDSLMMHLDLFHKYDRSEAQPFGSVNPMAPANSNEFQFMVGKFVCDDSLLVNGQWRRSRAIWETAYTLNGLALQDQYRNDQYAGA